MQYTDGERQDLRLDFQNERIAALEQRVYYLENALKELLYEKSAGREAFSRLLNAVIQEKLTLDTARDFFAIEKILYKDRDDLAGRKEAEREFNRAARIIDAAKGKN